MARGRVTALARWVPDMVTDIDVAALLHPPLAADVHIHQRPAAALESLAAEVDHDATFFHLHHLTRRRGNFPFRRWAAASRTDSGKIDGCPGAAICPTTVRSAGKIPHPAVFKWQSQQR